MKLKNIINEPTTPTLKMFEAAYLGNLGMTEMFKFFQKATPEQKALMDQIAERNDWEGFKKLIKTVLNIDLMPQERV